mmetsp:Transcript_24703/g.51340  ORF Transcript_24703/g.51340 Transcript_24703/m.51340 type:complete len:266 (-) Transcript_24703:533-1330(-)
MRGCRPKVLATEARPDLPTGHSELRLRNPLDDRRVRGASALADGQQRVAAPPPLELVEQRRHELGACAAERMAQRHGPAVDVQPLEVRAQGLAPGQGHRREGFVHLVEVHVFDLEACLGKRTLGGRNGPLEHEHWVRAGECQGVDPGARPEAKPLEAVLVADEHCRCPVTDLGRRCRRHDAGREHRLQLRSAVVGDAWSDALVLRVHAPWALPLDDLCGHRYNLGLELPCLRGRVSALLGHEAKLVDILFGESILLPKELSPTKL